MFTIDPMVVAYGPHREKSRFTYMHHAGEKVDIPYVSWLLQGEGMNVLVDVGCSADDYSEHLKPKDRPLTHAGETFDDVIDVKPIAQHLKERGLSGNDIDVVVLTHLDWDHCMSAPLFESSRILVQRNEWENTPSHPFFLSAYAPQHVYDEIGALDLTLLDGDHRIADGLELVSSPGHTPGGQSVVIDTPRGRYVIAGLCTLLENFYPSEEITSHAAYSVIPPGGHTDLFASYDSMQRLKEIGQDNVLPVHMGEVMTMGPIR